MSPPAKHPCGHTYYSLDVIIAALLASASRCADARRALDNMRLALPSIVGATLTEVRLDLPIWARRLRCHNSSCSATEAVDE